MCIARLQDPNPPDLMRHTLLFLIILTQVVAAEELAINSGSIEDDATAKFRQAASAKVRTTASILHPDGTHQSFRTRTNTNTSRGFALLEARAAARSGDTIVVGTGVYKISSSLAKDGVNWHFLVGAVIRRTDESEGALWDDRNTRMTFSVTGDGDFTRVTTSNLIRSLVVRVRHPDSVISIHGRDFTAIGPLAGRADASVLRLEGGRLMLEGRYLRALGNRNGYALWWFNGTGVVRAALIAGDYVSVGASVVDSPTGDFHVTAEQIETAIFSSNAQSTAAMWIRCNTLRDMLPDGGAVSITGVGRIYIEAQKVFGFVYQTSFQGLLYLRADKHTATIAGGNGFYSYLNVDGGETFYSVSHIDPNGIGGDSFAVTDGILHWGTGTLSGSATTKGVSISGGTVRMSGVTLNTFANPATSPIAKGGGTLILDAGTTLVAGNNSESISASTAQNVKVYGNAVANRPKSDNITIQIGTLTVDSNVE